MPMQHLAARQAAGDSTKQARCKHKADTGGRTAPSSVNKWMESPAMHSPTGCCRPVPLLTSLTRCMAPA